MTPRNDVTLLLDLLCLGKPLPQERAQEWRKLSEAPDLLALLEYEGAELWLYRQLRELGLESAPAFDQALRQAAHRDTIRGLRIDDEAVAALTMFRDAGIPCALIKGQARRAAVAIYPWANARASSDVDLLLPAERARQAWELLMGSGYTHAVDPLRSYDDHLHLPPVWSDRQVAVELHTSTSPYVSSNEAWRRATDQADQLTWQGLRVTVPSATELLWHGMAHAFLDGHAGARLRHLLVGAAVLAAKREIDWECIQRRINSDEVREHDTGFIVPPAVQQGWLAAAARLGGVELPLPFGVHCPTQIGTLLHWRRTVLGAAIGRAARERLLEEATRAEFRLPYLPSPSDVPVWKSARRAVTSLAARLSYHIWRSVAST